MLNKKKNIFYLGILFVIAFMHLVSLVTSVLSGWNRR